MIFGTAKEFVEQQQNLNPQPTLKNLSKTSMHGVLRSDNNNKI
jgi:hypothetical protein